MVDEADKKKAHAFLDDIEAVCRKHNMSISHQDGHGSFEIHSFDSSNIEWLRYAADTHVYLDVEETRT